MYGVITSLFGERIHPITGKLHFHNGLDIAAPVGTPVVAIDDGIVLSCRETDGYGRMILYQTVKNYVVLYAHLDEILVVPNERISFRQVIAKSGNTGLSTGPHLHYSIQYNRHYIDPLYFVDLPLTSEVKKRLAKK